MRGEQNKQGGWMGKRASESRQENRRYCKKRDARRDGRNGMGGCYCIRLMEEREEVEEGREVT